jgi:two-component sensor histidine kinase
MIKKHLINSFISSLILIFIGTTSLLAQDNNQNGIDSVIIQIDKLYRKDSNKALAMLDSIKVIVDKTGKEKQKFNFHLQYYKVVYYTKGEKNKALFHLHQAKKYTDGFKDLALIYNKLGQYHHRGSSMLDSSMYYQIKAIENIKKHPDTYSLTHYYLDLGDLYITLGDLPKAAEFMDKSLEIARKGGKRIDYGYSLHNAINVYKELKDSVKISALEAEYVAFMEGKSTQTAVAHQNTTFIADPVVKKKYLEESIEKHQVNQNLTMLLTNRLLLSDQLRDEKKYAQAIKILEDGLPSLNDSILLFRLNYYTKLKKLHEWNGNYKTALMYADSALVMERTLLDEKRLDAIREMEAKYHKLEQDNQILILQKQQDATNRNMYLALLGAGFIASLALGIYLLYRQKSKTNGILEQKNKQITGMLQEKDLLLREIHHRVKNNLQVVSSLLNLQSNYITDEIALEAINEGKNRVLSMALIHQNLYSDEHLTAIETKGYFDDLLDQLFESYNIDEQYITLEKEIDNFLIDVDTMIPLGLITNELISNALKHAFKDRAQGKIYFSVKDFDGNIIITIRDNGIGVEPSSFATSRSFGNKMIQAFVQKMKANLQVRNDNGTEIILSVLRVSEHEKRA